MDKPESRIRIDLTDDQRQQIRDALGKDVPSLEFTFAELEERIAPVSLNFGGVKWTYTEQG